MTRFFIPLIWLLFLSVAGKSRFGSAGEPSCPKDLRPAQTAEQLIYYDYAELSELRKGVRHGDKTLVPAFQALLSRAAGILPLPPEKVTDGDLPPSGNPHDFYAIGKLAFPNPNTPDGLPYIRKDGVTNPEADGDRYDLARYNRTLRQINELALAYFFSGDEKFAAKARELLAVWFLAPDTRMNPNLNNASALPGVYNGMPIGIIFSVALIKMLDHVKLLETSKAWSAADSDALKRWFADYTTWLLESELGKKEAKGTNNHGSWYTAQVAAFSLYSGHPERAREVLKLAKKQIDQQLTAEGSMPRELARQRSLHYSVYGLQAFTITARCADYFDEDLWHYKTADGRGLELAFRFLAPYLSGEREWTWHDIEKGNPPATGAIEIFGWAAKKYTSESFRKTLQLLQQRYMPPQSGMHLTQKTTS